MFRRTELRKEFLGHLADAVQYARPSISRDESLQSADQILGIMGTASHGKTYEELNPKTPGELLNFLRTLALDPGLAEKLDTILGGEFAASMDIEFVPDEGVSLIQAISDQITSVRK